MTFKELIVLLCSAEACLNICYLTPLSANFTDFQALTFGQFLNGTSSFQLLTLTNEHRINLLFLADDLS